MSDLETSQDGVRDDSAAPSVATLAEDANSPVILEQLRYEIDYNNTAKALIAAALSKVPGVGFGLGALLRVLWPSSSQDVWAEIRDKVEALVDEKISQRVWQDVSDKLTGLNHVLEDYVYTLQHLPDDKNLISIKWNVAQGHLLHDLPSFQSKGYEELLLPLFAQFANLHLLLLRDGAQFGTNWGWSNDAASRVRSQLSQAVASYSPYTQDNYDKGLKKVREKAPSNRHKTEPFNTVNGYQREMTLTVLDFMTMWSYLDLEKYPGPVDAILDREIYSDLVGTADDNRLVLPSPPTQPIKTITVWGWDRIDAVKLDYPAGGGPDGVTSTGRRGNRSGGSNKPPQGGVFDIAVTGPVTRVVARTGDIFNALFFDFEGGQRTGRMGGRYQGGKDSTWEYPGEILSSLRIMGVSKFYHSADAAVFGFKFPDGRVSDSSADVLRVIGTSAPPEATVDQVAEQWGLDGATREQLRQWWKDYGWDVLRTHHWGVVRERLARFEAEESAPPK